MQAPPGSSLPPLIVVAPPIQQQAVLPSTVVLPAAWPPAGDLVSAFDDHGGAVAVGHEHDQDGVPSHGATAAAPVAAAPSQKPVVTEELKAKIVKQVRFSTCVLGFLGFVVFECMKDLLSWSHIKSYLFVVCRWSSTSVIRTCQRTIIS